MARRSKVRQGGLKHRHRDWVPERTKPAVELIAQRDSCALGRANQSVLKAKLSQAALILSGYRAQLMLCEIAGLLSREVRTRPYRRREFRQGSTMPHANTTSFGEPSGM